MHKREISKTCKHKNIKADYKYQTDKLEFLEIFE